MPTRFQYRLWNTLTRSYMNPSDDMMPFLCHDGKLRIEYDFADVTEDLILEQSTGLLDSNGDLIFEGDILRSDRVNKSLAMVLWINGKWVLKGKCPVGKVSRNLRANSASCGKIVGNVNEDLDLLNEVTG